jgi:hypothetical protein
MFMGRKWIFVFVFASLISVAQKSEWQQGIITEVVHHTAAQDAKESNYDISVRVGNVIYVVLYSVPGSTSVAQYRVGVDLMVLVKGATLTFNDLQGNAHRVKILRKQTPAASTKR